MKQGIGMRKIVKLVIPLTILALPIAVYPEVGVLEVDHYCGFKREQSTARKRFNTFDADQDAMRVIKRITRYVGMMNPRFDVKGADISTGAAAVIRNDKRYILYNPYFITKVAESTGSSWAEVSVLAHEIGHHVNWHTLKKDGSRPNKELEADHFAGYILQRMGASIDDAVNAMNKLADEQASDTHPAKYSRVTAIASGWREARGQRPTPSIPVKPGQSASGTASVSHSHNGRSHNHPLPAEGLNHQHNGVQSAQPVARPAPAPIAPQVQYKEPEMISIRGGTFMMGSPAREKRRNHNEKQHSVAVANFSIGKYEVSNEEYSRCVTDGACEPPAWQEKGSNYNIQTGGSKHYLGFNGANQPVVGVSWNDAVDYASWLSKKTGKKYSLPTEAQWEYAARAGSTNAYPWGKSIGSGRANCKDCGSTSGKKTTTPVKSYSPNAWGLHNTVGNVWEWVCSVYDSAYDGGEQQCTSTSDAYNRVLRGGAWSVGSDLSRSAYRGYKRHSFTFNDIGFRLSRNP